MPGPSYVELALPADLRDVLHGLTARVAAAHSENFRPMAPDKLHCTVFFHGRALITGPPASSRAALAAMRAACCDRVGTVRLGQLTLFPPDKQNLLVVLLDVPDEWHAARRTLGHAVDAWVPHVTLGKFSGTRRPDTFAPATGSFAMPFHLAMAGPTLRGSRCE